MKKILIAAAAAFLAAAGCAPIDLPDLEGGAVRGTVVDKVAMVTDNGEAAMSSSAWYLRVESANGTREQIEVTYRAFSAVDTGDILPDDLTEKLPRVPGEETPWR